MNCDPVSECPTFSELVQAGGATEPAAAPAARPAAASAAAPAGRTAAARPTAEALARSIRLLVLDVDGVLTDGGLYYDANGLVMKRFHVHDGIGIRIALDAGIDIAVLSGMDVPCVRKRLEELHVTHYVGGKDNKATLLDELRRELGLEWHEIAYLGDDWVDMAPMLRVGLPAAVANAQPDVKEIARIVMHRSGGNGAVREMIDFLLICQGKRDALVQAWKNLV